jgi:hypothetical protein
VTNTDMTTLDDNTTDETEAASEPEWAPLGFDEGEITTYFTPREDIPEYLKTSLWDWIQSRFGVFDPLEQDRSTRFDNEFLRKCERKLRIHVPYVFDWVSNAGVRSALEAQGDIAVWRLVDFMIFEGRGEVSELRQILLEAGSAWDVGIRMGKRGLLRRVPDGVAVAVEAAINHPNGGKKLAEAWEAAYGVYPDPSKAYSMAVKAVEDAAIPVVCPNDRTATLGKVIGIANSGTWKLPHLREDANAPTHDVLLGMMRTLWTGQHDRHGGPSAVGVPAVTQDEAESAVMIAVTLVGLFETGKVQP